QRILADGTVALGWPANGAPATREPGTQVLPFLIPDGNGGAFVTWDDEYAPTPDARLQHLGPDGTVASGWPSDGLQVCTAPGIQAAGRLSPDGSGGVIMAWQDLRDASPAVYAQRVAATGQPSLGWPENGALIVTGRYLRDLASDGAGGAYLSCAT